jgi:hypothetical protein
MKKIVLALFIFIVLSISIFVYVKNRFKSEEQLENMEVANFHGEKEEINKLIKQVLSWSESRESVKLLPVLADSLDSIYIGFDMDKLTENIDKLKETRFFSTEFIENYEQIIITLDRKLKNKEFNEWLVGDLPPFKFHNNYNPWWGGQESFPVQLVIVEIVSLSKDKGEFYFKCGGKEQECRGLENYKMKFRVVKENNEWKISYLLGFDHEESIRKDGVI